MGKMHSTISIAVELVHRYACDYSTEERKKMMTILSFAIWCKMQHTNGVIFAMGVKQLRKVLHVSYKRATYILQAIKEDTTLFKVVDDKYFKVKSFRDKTIKYTRKGNKYRGAHVYTLEVNKEYTIKDIYKRLNQLMFLRQISSEEQNCSHVSENLSCKCRSNFITMKQFKNALGMSHTSCCKIKKQLLNNDEIKSTLAEVHSADERCPEQVDRLCREFNTWKPTFRAKGRAYFVKPCQYYVISRKAKASCGRFKIYDYAKFGMGIHTTCKGRYAALETAYGMPD